MREDIALSNQTEGREAGREERKEDKENKKKRR
jgi:hypothetical protein